ncbi:peptidyl-prolyl cis-trans isomerase C [Rhodovulum imhoffii]|uniref:Parvulin-like PPIase n=1 Tax=Rhodovulum imhoffii TaxID=365340 RepID=A0A2T5BP77_9RHOB|nr:peptidylprolyl isomerase [Rhodovulum imhoffii]MBK5933977.1 peptidylprolyl isomerase [Rhodovulum imhoffii]PTN00810.1 peptidyl-prolyl cis-trans isomerase C [Rhodovulum imhoffii]
MPKASTALALVLAVGLATPVLSQTPVTADTVVATVEGTDITLGHMIVLRAQLPAEYQNLPDDMLYEAVLDQLVRQTAVAASAEDALSKGAELALENERRSYIAGEALSRVAETAVTDEALQAAYDKAFKEADPTTEYHAAHILVQTEEEAAKLKEALDGGADFADLAREHSTGPSGPGGGDLGWFEAGTMVKPFEDAVMALEPGQISAPVETQFGWHVVKLAETRQKDAPALEEVRDELTADLQTEAIAAEMERLTEAAEITHADVEIDPALLRNRDLLNN